MPSIELPYLYAPRSYQLPLWRYMDGQQRGKRAVLVRHRRAGKDTDAINVCAVKAFERVGTYIHLFPTNTQGRAVIWTGLNSDGRRFVDYFPKQLVASENGTFMSMTLKNNSVYRVWGCDNPAALRGINPVGVVFSEYQDCDPSVFTKIIEPILMENGGWALFLGTPKGKNHFYKLYQSARSLPGWHHEILTIRDTKRPDGTPVIDEAYIEDLRRRGVAEETIQAEYYCDFNQSVIGSYYGKQMQAARDGGRVGKVKYDPHVPVDTAWDIGFADTAVVIYWQTVGNSYQIIDCDAATGEALPYYAKLIKDKEYTYGTHFVPHDMAAHEMATGKRRVDVMRELGVKMKIVEKHAVEDGIEQVRGILGRCYFDEEKLDFGEACLLKAMAEYTKEWDDTLKVFRSVPKHDWASHFADAFRILAMSLKRGGRMAERPQRDSEVTSYV